MLAFLIYDTRIKMIIEFGTTKSINTYLQAIHSNSQFKNLKCVLIDLAAPN